MLASRPPRPFVLLTAPRSGSNWLLTMLGQHEAVRTFFEVLHEDPKKRTPVVGADGTRTRVCGADEDGATFIEDHLFGRWYRPEVRSIGFKQFYGHATIGPSRSVWDYLAHHPTVRVVHLVRKGLLGMFVSHQRATRTQEWLVRADDASAERPPATPEHVDYDEFRDWVVELKDQRAAALGRLRGRPIHTLSYESLRARKQWRLTRLLLFLRVWPWPDVRNLRETTVRQATRPLRERIENYEELKQRSRGTALARYVP